MKVLVAIEIKPFGDIMNVRLFKNLEDFKFVYPEHTIGPNINTPEEPQYHCENKNESGYIHLFTVIV